ncbi:MAG: hypothetical protein AAF399_01100, partial [Bacteroidota bacterium]
SYEWLFPKSVSGLLTNHDVGFPASGISQVQRTYFLSAQKVGKKAPKPHATHWPPQHLGLRGLPAVVVRLAPGRIDWNLKILKLDYFRS